MPTVYRQLFSKLPLDEAFARLRDTNFRCPENIMTALLSQHAGGSNG